MWDKLNNPAWIGGCIGLACFFGCFGTGLIHPQYIEWLLQDANHDAIQHFVGWEFFRNEAWHFPLGLIERYGYPTPTSIVYTDSIPLFALIFKCFSALLPLHFQYMGFWYVLCFFLQGYFAWLLSTYLRVGLLGQFIITLFFLLSPIMLNRMIEHEALMGHWVLLAGLCLYLRPYQANVHRYWLGLNSLTLLIHAYLALMSCGLWAAFLLRYIVIDARIGYAKAWRLLLAMMITMGMVAWLSGYFVISFTGMTEAGGYQLNALNLLAPFKPGSGAILAPGNWSAFITPFIPFYIEQGDEGFNYLGLGMLVLWVVSIGCLLYKRPSKERLSLALPLIIICVLLTCYALSNVAYIGDRILFSYPLPGVMAAITGLFRASGRFFWPVYYCLMISAFYIIHSRVKEEITLTLFSLALILQCADLSGKVKELHDRFSHKMTHPAPAYLDQLPNAYAHLVFLPVVNRPHLKIKHFGQYVHYAALHNLSVNLSYLARQENSKHTATGRAALRELLQGKVARDTIYIILNPRLAAKLKRRLRGAQMVDLGIDMWGFVKTPAEKSQAVPARA